MTPFDSNPLGSIDWFNTIFNFLSLLGSSIFYWAAGNAGILYLVEKNVVVEPTVIMLSAALLNFWVWIRIFKTPFVSKNAIRYIRHEVPE